MFENTKRLLTISKEKNVDLSVAYAMAYNDEMQKDGFDKSKLDSAKNLIDDYYEEITKMWNQGNLEALETLCNLVEEGDMEAVGKLLKEWL